MTDKIDVAQLVIRTETDLGYRYILARRTKDGYWEWIGGKKEDGETLKEAAVREMKEELNIEWNEVDYSIEKLGDTYLSKDDESYRLNPVLIELSEEVSEKVDKKSLSREHDEFAWIDLTEYGRFETLGQYRALEHLEIVNGDTAVAAVERDGKFLAVKRSEQNSTPGKWCFVSGRIEEGETPEEAAKREVEEETGLQTEVNQKGDFYIGKGEKGYWRLFPVLLETVDGEVDLNWELSEYRWIEIDELEEMETLGRMEAVERLNLREIDRRIAIAVPQCEETGGYLAIKRSESRDELPGVWEFPSGDVEKGESMEEAALRELREETGLEGEILSWGDTHTREKGGRRLKFFPFKVEVEKSEVELSEEHSDYRWITGEKSGEMETQENFYRVMDDVD